MSPVIECHELVKAFGRSRALDGMASDVHINWVWMPPWGPEKITGDGREMLRALGFNV